MRRLSVIIPSFRSACLDRICISSFEAFRPRDLEIQYIVIENSNETEFKDELCSLADNITWINNATQLRGSEANAEALQIGLKHVITDLVFMAHCDVCVTHRHFFYQIFDQYDSGNRVVGTLFDNHENRIRALHVSGLLTDVSLARSVHYMPRYENGIMRLDVGDEITEYCRLNDIIYCCFDNTYNDSTLKCIYGDFKDFCVDRCLDDTGNVIYMHLGRGIPKVQGTYNKNGRIGIAEWKMFCGKLLN